MKKTRQSLYQGWLPVILLSTFSWNLAAMEHSGGDPGIQFTLSFPDPGSGSYHVEMRI